MGWSPSELGNRGRYAGVLILAASCLLLPAPALGSTVDLDFNGDARVQYEAALGETNTVTINLAGGTYTVTDSAGIVAGSGCAQVSGTQATCPDAGVFRVTAEGRDLNDNITVNAAPPLGAVLHGGSGTDTLRGGPADDRFHGGDGNDTLRGGDGDDVFDGGLGNDTLDGQNGSDTASYSARTEPVRVDLSFKIGGQSGGEIALNERDGLLANVENAIGGAGDDEIVGGEGYNLLSGGPGGSDIICGGLGVDTVDYSDRTTPVRVSLDGAMDTDPNIGTAFPAREDCREISNTPTPGVPRPPGQGARDCVRNDGADADSDGVAEEQDCVGEDIENILGGTGADTLVGNNPDLRIAESPRVEPRGRNLLVGGAGNDLLDGLFGPDVFEGGAGVDTVTYAGRVVAVNATIDGAADDGDTIGPIGGDAEPGDGRRDNIETDVENVEGGGGDDVLRGDPDANRLEGGGGADVVFGGDGTGADDTLSGGGGNDSVHGGDGDDLVQGGDGDDFLDGGAGADQLRGEAGNDQLAGRSGGDAIGGGEGSDVADYSGATTPVLASPDGSPNDGTAAEGDNIDVDVEGAFGGTDSDVLVGNMGAGIFSGSDGDDRIDPSGGADAVSGGAGFDAVSYATRTVAVRVDLGAPGGDGGAGENDDLGADVEQVTGGTGDDQITGTASANTLVGGGGNDRLAGADGLDLLTGGAGNDVLQGGAGADGLSGGDGNDGLDGGTASDALDGGAGDDQAVYSARTGAVTVTLDGEPDDGAQGENDRIKTNVEGAATGAGADKLDTRDDVAGDVSCGRGRDELMADTADRVDADCEQVNGRAFGVCTASTRGLRAVRGRVTVRLSCAFASRGTVRLTTTKAVRTRRGARARKLRLGSGSFSARAARTKSVRVKLSRDGRRVLNRMARVRVRVTVISRPRGKAAQSSPRRRSNRVVTLRARAQSGGRR
jgi:Ca2+-binding RTX toxin-like protein